MREPSSLRAAAQLAFRALRDTALPARPGGAVPRRRIAVERAGIDIDARRVEAFRRVIACGEPPSVDDALLPPTYPALWETALALELLAAAKLPLPTRGLIHLGGEMVQLRPLRRDDRPRCRVELDGVEPHPRGLRLTLLCRGWTGSGQLCREARLELLARLPDAAGGSARPAGRRDATQEPAGWHPVREWALPADQGRRYARVSGDFNPIHLWAWSARPFGYRRPILHGFCLEAMVADALVRQHAGGDPAALRRLRITFRSPLSLPARPRLESAPSDSGSGGRFRVLEGEGRVVAQGEWVGGREGIMNYELRIMNYE